MKKLLLVFFTVWITVSGFAQKTADIGIWGGTSNYFGDMSKAPPFQTFNLNFGGYFRYNFNTRVSVRAMFLTGNFKQLGEIKGTPWTYSKNVQDLSLQVEINYLKYILGERKTPFSSYVTVGIGMVYFPYEVLNSNIAQFNPKHPDVKNSKNYNQSQLEATIPFGIGIKYNIGRRLGVGLEYQMRKIFSDKLDNLDDPLSYYNSQGELAKYTSAVHNNDWSSYLGVHLTYMIYMGKSACPVYDSKIK
jgi:opacity protein-like surface antigen